MTQYRSLSTEHPLFREFQLIASKMAQGATWDDVVQAVKQDDLLQVPSPAARKRYLTVLKARIRPFDRDLLALAASSHDMARWGSFLGLIIENRLFRELFYDLIWSSMHSGKTQLTGADILGAFNQKRLEDPALMAFTDETWERSRQVCMKMFKEMGYLHGSDPWTPRNPFCPRPVLAWLMDNGFQSIAKLVSLEK